jgi:ABC-type spermidine/putrescine transport system permease subunit II
MTGTERRAVIDSLTLGTGTTIVATSLGLSATRGVQRSDSALVDRFPRPPVGTNTGRSGSPGRRPRPGRVADPHLRRGRFPQAKEGLVVWILITNAISIQAFVMTLLLAGKGTQTIPALAWRSISQVPDPVMNVVSTLSIVIVTVALLIAASLIGPGRIARQL